MSQRLAALIALAAFILLVMGAWLWGGNLGLADGDPGRISFQIATGSTEGIYFPVGQAMAGVISHPPGIGRCETATVCGPAGVILSARTSQGAADNLRSVDSGAVDSGLAEGDVIAAAVTGRPPFRRRASHLRVVAALFREPAQLVARPGIDSVASLKGKRVMLGGGANTGAVLRSRVLLQAWGLSERSVRIVPYEEGAAAQMLREGKLDAFLLVSGVPVDAVRDLLARGLAHLVPLDGEGRERLIRLVPQFQPAVIPAGAYPHSPAIETVAVRAWWVTRDSEPDSLIYGLTRALFNPVNRPLLLASHPSAREIGLESAALNPPAPIHSGAARYYREMGKLPAL